MSIAKFNETYETLLRLSTQDSVAKAFLKSIHKCNRWQSILRTELHRFNVFDDANVDHLALIDTSPIMAYDGCLEFRSILNNLF